MESIVTQIKSLVDSADEASRRRIQDSLIDLQHAIETPYDTLQRFAGLVRTS